MVWFGYFQIKLGFNDYKIIQMYNQKWIILSYLNFINRLRVVFNSLDNQLDLVFKLK